MKSSTDFITVPKNTVISITFQVKAKTDAEVIHIGGLIELVIFILMVKQVVSITKKSSIREDNSD